MSTDMTGDLDEPHWSAGRGRIRRALVLGASMVLVVAGVLVFLSQRPADRTMAGAPASGGSLVNALAGRTWVSIDHAGTRLPYLRLSSGSGGFEVDLYDGCNDGEGTFRLDGNVVTDSMIMTTAMGCGDRNDAAAIWNGTTFDLADSVLTVTNLDSIETSTRYIDVDALEPVEPGDIIGTYTLGVAPLTISASRVAMDDCEFEWSVVDQHLAFDPTPCKQVVGPSQTVAYAFDSVWRNLRSDGELVIASAGDDFSQRFIRLDRTGPGSELRPSLPALLGEIADRTWILDHAAPTAYTFGARPTVRFAGLSDAVDGHAALVEGFDGCDAISRAGQWTPSGNGWALTTTEPGAAGGDTDCEDGRRVWLVTGVTVTIQPDGQLTVTEPDGPTLTFRDPLAIPNSDPTFSPVAHVAGAWRLDDGAPVVNITVGQPGEGHMQASGSLEAAPGFAFTFGTCSVGWFGTGNRWIDTTPDWPTDPAAACLPDAGDPTSRQFFELLLEEGAMTVGVTEDDTTMYLTNAAGNRGFVLTRA